MALSVLGVAIKDSNHAAITAISQMAYVGGRIIYDGTVADYPVDGDLVRVTATGVIDSPANLNASSATFSLFLPDSLPTLIGQVQFTLPRLGTAVARWFWCQFLITFREIDLDTKSADIETNGMIVIGNNS